MIFKFCRSAIVFVDTVPFSLFKCERRCLLYYVFWTFSHSSKVREDQCNVCVLSFSHFSRVKGDAVCVFGSSSDFLKMKGDEACVFWALSHISRMKEDVVYVILAFFILFENERRHHVSLLVFFTLIRQRNTS